MASEQDNVWNNGQHFRIVKGSILDSDDYLADGWYLDASSYKGEIEGTLHYYRSFRNDGRDYMRQYVTKIGYTSG
jgi:hypothetical protein